MKQSIRFGIRLGWPIVNAATFVTKINANDYMKFGEAVNTIKTMLTAAGSKDIADRIVFEAR